MKTSLFVIALFAASVALTGCFPAWFQTDKVSTRDDQGTRIYCDAINQTDPVLTLEAIFINDVNVGPAMEDGEPLEWGEKFSFQIGYGLWRNSAQYVRGRAPTGGGYSEIGIYAHVYAIGRLPDGTKIAVYPKDTNREGSIRLTSGKNNTLIFEDYKISRPTLTENPRKQKRR